MVEWREQGILLASRRHGETSAIIDVFTPAHGRHAGVVRGGGGRKMAPILQPGAQLDVAWRARLDDHLGAFTVEPVQARAAHLMQDRLALTGLAAITALLAFVLPERAAYPRLYAKTIALLDMLASNPAWPYAYLLWETALLDEVGVGLDLSRCTVTGATENLIYVSPKTGRAVSKAAAGQWVDKMLPLPACLRGEGYSNTAEIAEALGTTGFFLKTKLAPQLGNREIPQSRQRLIDLLERG